MILVKAAIAFGVAGLTTLALKIVRDIYKHEAYKAYESASGKKLQKDSSGNYDLEGAGIGDGDAVDAFRHVHVSAALAQDYWR